MAHAHYLAREMKATATLPDGSTKPLIWINDWDFNWQDSYVYKEPFTLPKGTRIDVTLTYDNSADNPRNPISPPRRALWGEQSFDEMGMVGFGFEVVNKADVPAFQQALGGALEGGDCRRRARTARSAVFWRRNSGEDRGLQQLTVFDRQGTVVSRVGEPGSYSQAAFSPDGSAAGGDQARSRQRRAGRVDVRRRRPARARRSPRMRRWIPRRCGRLMAARSPTCRCATTRTASIDAPPTARAAKSGCISITTGAPIVLTDWSADGRFLCFWYGDTMFVLPLDRERRRRRSSSTARSSSGAAAGSRPTAAARVQLEPVRTLPDLRQADCDVRRSDRASGAADAASAARR